MANVTIEWYGLSCLKIVSKQTVGEVTVLTDPIGPDEGAKMPRGVEADIVLVTAGDADEARDLVGGKPFVVSHPGEYESKGVFVYGVAVGPKEGEKAKVAPPSVYRIEIDDLSIVHLGCLDRPLTDKEYDRLADVDVLFLPVGGHGSALTAAEAAEVMTRIEPRIVVPICFDTPGLRRELDPVERFLKEAGIAPERMEKLKVAKKDLPQDETKLIILSA